MVPKDFLTKFPERLAEVLEILKIQSAVVHNFRSPFTCEGLKMLSSIVVCKNAVGEKIKGYFC